VTVSHEENAVGFVETKPGNPAVSSLSIFLYYCIAVTNNCLQTYLNQAVSVSAKFKRMQSFYCKLVLNKSKIFGILIKSKIFIE